MKRIVLILTLFMLFAISNAQDFDKAFGYFENKDYHLAAKEFKLLLETAEAENGRDKSFAEICLFLAVSNESVNEIETAISYYKLCNKTYQSAPNGLTESYYGVSLNNLALLYNNMGDYEKALPLYREAIENAEKSVGKDHPFYGTILNNIALLYNNMGRYEKALPLYIETLENKEKSLGKEHSEYGISLNNLAGLYEAMGQYKKALPLYIEALENTEKSLGKDHSSYGSRLNNLAGLYRTIGEYEKALTLYLAALKNTEKSLGKDHSTYGVRLSNLAGLYKAMGQYEKAFPLYLEALENTEKSLGKEHASYGTRLNNIAGLYEAMGQYEKALPLYIEALENTEKSLGKDHSEYGSRLNNLAGLYMTMGQYEKAFPLYLEALENTEKSLGKDHSEYGTRLNNLAFLYNEMGQYKKALPLYLEAIENAEKSLGKDHSSYGTSLNNLAVLYQGMGQYEKALTLFLDALENTEKSLGKDHSDYGSRLNNLAGLYKNMGQDEKALALYLEALENAEQFLGKDHLYYGTSLNNLALLYNDMGDYEKALSLYLEALENTEKSLGKDHSNYGTSLNNLALLYNDMGQYEKALTLFLEALENTEKSLGKDHSNYGVRLNNLAGLYKNMGEYEKAFPLYLEALENQEKSLGKDHSYYGCILNNFADLYNIMGQFEKALPLYQQGLNVIETNIDLNFSFLSENEKELYLKTVHDNFKKFNSFVFLHKDIFSKEGNDVLDQTLITKGMLLKSSTAMRSAILSSDDSDLKSTYNEWIGLKKQIARLYSTEISKRYENVKDLEERTNILERVLVKGSQEFMDYQNLNAVNWQKVRDSLKPNEAAIEFISFKYFNKEWTDSTLYCALVLKHNSEYTEMIPLFEEKELEDYLINSKSGNNTELVAKLYGEKRGAHSLGSNNITTNYGDSLYSLIWNPVDSLLKGVERVYYSSSGKLNNISFAAIPYNDSLLLSDKYHMEYVSTTGRIANSTDSKIELSETKAAIYGGLQYDVTTEELLAGSQLYENNESDKLLVYNRSYRPSDSSRGGSWNYLRGTLQESDNIGSIIKSKNVSTSLYQGTKGNEESFKALTGNNSPKIIHLATHGFFFPDPEKQLNNDQMGMSFGNKKAFQKSDNPLIRSGLILSGGNQAWKGETLPEGVEDGILTAYEVSGMNLFNTQLVVLSACETGLGEIKGSEGVYGLQRSFKMAGVDYLIMSLWQVPDKETSEFMTLFYTKLLESKDIRLAFEETQKTMRHKYDPYYWAAFVLMR